MGVPSISETFFQQWMICYNLLLILRSLIQLEANLFRTMWIYVQCATRRCRNTVQLILSAACAALVTWLPQLLARRGSRPMTLHGVLERIQFVHTPGAMLDSGLGWENKRVMALGWSPPSWLEASARSLQRVWWDHIWQTKLHSTIVHINIVNIGHYVQQHEHKLIINLFNNQYN